LDFLLPVRATWAFSFSGYSEKGATTMNLGNSRFDANKKRHKKHGKK